MSRVHCIINYIIYLIELGAGVDEMAVLEEQARKIAEVAKKDQPKPKTTVAFVK